MRHKSLESFIQNHKRPECSESAQQQRIALYKNDQQEEACKLCVQPGSTGKTTEEVSDPRHGDIPSLPGQILPRLSRIQLIQDGR